MPRLVRCGSCGRHLQATDARCGFCAGAGAPAASALARLRRLGTHSKGALIAASLLGLSSISGCASDDSPTDGRAQQLETGPQPAYGVPPIEAGAPDAGPAPDLRPDGLGMPAYGIPPTPDASSN